MGVVCALLGQVAEAPDSLEVVFRRVQRGLTEQALTAQLSVLAHDRAVAVLVDRVRLGRAALADVQQRRRDLDVEQRVLEHLRLDDLTESARDRHLERLAALQASRVELREAEAKTCRALVETVSEIKGRVEGKIDTLHAVEQTCGTAPQTWCAGLQALMRAFETLAQGVAIERRLTDDRCPP